MSAKSHTTPSKIRTFASDLEAERKKQNLSSPTEQTTKAQKQVTKPETEKPVVKPKTEEAEMVKIVEKHEPKKVETKEPEPVEPEKPKIKKGPHIVIEPTEKRAAPAPKKIPAFHELQKQKPKKPSADKQEDHRPNIGYDATIITDTKREGFKLFPSIIASIKDWFKKQSIKRKKKKAPKYFVSDSSHRKGVIQEATSKSGAIFTADNDTLKEHIRKRKQREGPADEYDLNWSPFTESGYELLEDNDKTSNVEVVFKKQATEEKPKVENKVPADNKKVISEPVIIEPSPLPEKPAPTPQWGTETEVGLDTKEDEVFVEEQPEPIPEPEPVQEETVAEVIPEPISEEPKFPETKKRSAQSILDWADTNTLTVSLLFVLIGVIALGFTAKGVFDYLEETDPRNTYVELPAESLVGGATISHITLTAENLYQLPDLLKAGVDSSPGQLTEFAIVSPTGNEVNATYIFELLDFQMLQNLQQSITTVRFASMNQSTPVIVLQFVDIETVKGGLLQWEKTLAIDIDSLYPMSPEASEFSFVDDQVDGIDVRSLRKEGETILIYGIVGENTAIIAPSHALFTQILEAATSQ